MAAGFAALARYDNTPGIALRASPEMWPRASRLAHNPSLPTLVVSLHPRCSCSRATLANLARAMTQLKDKVTVDLLFVVPPNHESWRDGDLWRKARAIPGILVFEDAGGREFKRFAAQTSGEAVLYSPSGSLLFQGGMTSSRGHEGENAGLDAIVDFVRQGKAERSRVPVFGCSLEHPELAQNAAPARGVEGP